MTRAVLASFICCLLTNAAAMGQGQIHSVHYEPSNKPNELVYGVTYRVWIPENVKKLRGVIVHQHGCGKGACEGGRTAADDLHWQALAAKWDCALLGPSFEQNDGDNCRLWCDPRNGSRERFLQSLDDLAKLSGHPELATVPWCLWGHSGGAFWASLMMISDPQRIAAVWLRSGTAFSAWEKGEITKPEIPALTYKIPTMCNPGLKERDDKRFSGAWTGAMAMFTAYRAKGAPIGFAPDPKTSHECGDSRYMAIPFFDRCLGQRLSEGKPELQPMDDSKTWLSKDWESEPETSGSFKGDQRTSIWLPDIEFAKVWRSYTTTGSVPDQTNPSTPTLFRGFRTKSGDVELHWNAQADLESGLAGFDILRDNKIIATIPDKPNSQFGKSLFQGMSYHDTPKEPLAKMMFHDKNASENAEYQIRAINTQGLKSAFSSPLIVP